MKVRVHVGIPPVLPIKIGGPKVKKEVDAILDTGSTFMVVSPEDAVDLGYKPWLAKKIPVETAGGTVSVPLISLKFVEVFGFRKKNVRTIICDLSKAGIDSIIGWSFLKGFRFTIDSKDKILELELLRQ